MGVGLAPAFNKPDEAVLQANALMQPDSRAIGATNVPERVNRHTRRIRYRGNPTFLAQRGELLGVIRTFRGPLECLRAGAGVFLPHLLVIVGKVSATGSDVPSFLPGR